VSRDNKPFPLKAPDIEGPIDAIAGWHPNSYAGPQDIPQGIRIIAQTAQKTEPFPSGEPGPETRILYDGELYRTWGGNHYAESKDGFTWDNQARCVFDWNLCEVKGNDGGHDSGTVFIDPSAPPSERYKRIVMFNPASNEHKKRILAEFSRTRPDDIDPKAVVVDNYFSVYYAAVSPDGVHWKVYPEQLWVQVSEGTNVVEYNPLLERYVWYCRYWNYYGRRCVGRSETEEFRRWPAPEMLLWPSTDLHPSDDWYTNSKTMYPGTVDQHLMFPVLYHRNTDTADVHLFSSPDGIAWSQVPGGPVLSPGLPGSWDSGGWLWCGVGLVLLPGNRVGIPYVGSNVPHKYPRNKDTQKTKIAYAWWPKGRLAALESPEFGSFSTFPLVFSGRKLFLNALTLKAGNISVEVANIQGEPLPKRSFDEADPIVGDYFDIPVTWKGEADLGHKTGQPVILRFRMKAAKLFAFEFV